MKRNSTTKADQSGVCRVMKTAFRGEIDYFINHVIRRGEQPLSTLDDAADALRMIEAAEKSAMTSKKQTIAYA